MKKTSIALLALLSMTAMAHAEVTVKTSEKESISLGAEYTESTYDRANKAALAQAGKVGEGKTLAWQMAGSGKLYKLNNDAWAYATEAFGSGKGDFVLVDKEVAEKAPIFPISIANVN